MGTNSSNWKHVWIKLRYKRNVVCCVMIESTCLEHEQLNWLTVTLDAYNIIYRKDSLDVIAFAGKTVGSEVTAVKEAEVILNCMAVSHHSFPSVTLPTLSRSTEFTITRINAGAGRSCKPQIICIPNTQNVPFLAMTLAGEDKEHLVQENKRKRSSLNTTKMPWTSCLLENICW